MRITDVKINGIRNPLGFDFSKIKCSWKVTDTFDKEQKNARISLSLSADMNPVCYAAEGQELNSGGTVLKFKAASRTRYYVQIEVWGSEGDYGISDICYFETGKMEEGWRADYISTLEEDSFHPIFGREFSCEKEIESARIYITGLGLYEAYLNGRRIGEEFLAPFCNDYNKRIQYQTYDITELLERENEIWIAAGNGWYKGRLGYEGIRAFYGNQFGTIAELHIRYTDGTEETVCTDSFWKYKAGDILDSDIYDGEVIDHTFWQKKDNPWKPVRIMEFDKSKLVERYSIPVVAKKEIPVKEVIYTPSGETVLDFGQNFAGFVSFYADFAAGTKIVLDFGEILQQGNFYNDNYRTAKSQFTYVSDGRKEWIKPHFTYYGFRYVRVSGWKQKLSPENFKGVVLYSDLDTTMEFESSDEKLNRLAANAFWGQCSNFVDMPTDCPQRDERLGWTGDAQVFAPTASFQMDTRAFYRKFLADLRLEQMELDGAIPNFIPNYSKMPGGSSVWGDAGTFIPMTLYQFYGDKDALEESYPMMKDWTDYIIRQDEAHGGNRLWNFGMHFGDWLAMDGVTEQSMRGGTDDGFLASAYYYASLEIMEKAASVLGMQEEADFYQTKKEEVKAAILAEYLTPNGRLALDTQTAYLLALRFGLYREKDKIVEGLKVRLKKDCYKIKGGFVGATTMCQVLAANGMEDMAYYILFQEGFPGWMHCINLGATTIWERWNSVLDDGTISGTEMNSLNHYSYGSVMEYVYRYIAGICETKPGFQAVRFAPQINYRLNHVRCKYDSVSGAYVSEWTLHEDGQVTVHFEVPFGCSAVAVLPGMNGEEVKLSAGSFSKTYMPEKDFRQRYTMDSRLEEMKDDKEALAVLREELPIAVGMIEREDIENMCMSLRELQFMVWLGIAPDAVQKAAERLEKLR